MTGQVDGISDRLNPKSILVCNLALREYKVVTTDSGGTHKIQIFKNNVLLQTKTIDVTQFFGGDLSSSAISISNNGQYVIVYGPDAAVFSLDREIVIKGS